MVFDVGDHCPCLESTPISGTDHVDVSIEGASVTRLGTLQVKLQSVSVRIRESVVTVRVPSVPTTPFRSRSQSGPSGVHPVLVRAEWNKYGLEGP